LPWVSLHILQLLRITDFETVLHPRHKLSYFKNANWEPEWIEAARKIVRDEFDRSFGSDGTAEGGGEGAEKSSSQSSKVHLLSFVCTVYLLTNDVQEYF
jgi:hypothetical protein